ncbi:MAG: NADP-dependent isocitrate dehydrogenase, partial [bacterium]
PGSVILSGVMMRESMGWGGAARMAGMGVTTMINNGTVTYGSGRLMKAGPDVKALKCWQFSAEISTTM